MRAAENTGLFHWTGQKLDEETTEKMLKTHELGVLYETGERIANA